MEKTFIDPMFAGFYQIGFVTSDMDRSISFFEKTMGVPKFLKLEKPEIRNQTLYGEPLDIDVNLAFGQMGNTNIEIIEPIRGHSTYDEFLKKYEWMGIHNMAVKVFDYDATMKRLTDQGLKIAQAGEVGDSTKFTYLDTVKEYGHYLEVLYFDLGYEKIFDQIKRGDF